MFRLQFMHVSDVPALVFDSIQCKEIADGEQLRSAFLDASTNRLDAVELKIALDDFHF